MKKKLLTFLQILFVTTLLFSCKKNAEISINAFNNSEIVSVDVARKVATAYALNNFSLSNNDRVSNPSLRNSSQPVRKEIESEEVIQSGELPYFYIFNFKNKGGWVIISAEKREHPILAYNNKGEFKKDNAPYGIVSWIETQKENIDFIRQGKFSTQQQAEAEWNVVGKELGIVEIQKIAPPEPGCQEYSTNVTKGPLLSTEWGKVVDIILYARQIPADCIVDISRLDVWPLQCLKLCAIGRPLQRLTIGLQCQTHPEILKLRD
ncbi:MAG: Spi family protease inhibitor [Thermoflavifilum aggregans]|nr:Spi family protease inhibitor [Thermoflavifilum aggregans]